MKKNFDNVMNPAFNFIGTNDTEDKDLKEEVPEEEFKEPLQEQALEKYSIKDTASPLQDEEELPAGKINHRENKTKRVNLLMQPSVFNAAKQKAELEGISLNEYLHRLIIEDL